jgi:hypothetical protein
MKTSRKFLISAVALVIATAAYAQAHRPTFDSRAMPQPNARMASQTLVARVLASTHPTTFISPEEPFGCHNESDCEKKGLDYYRRIAALDANYQPTTPRSTLHGWLLANGFSSNPLAPAAGELRAVYYNRADLGFGRDLHCKSQRISIGTRAVEIDPRQQTARVANPASAAAAILPRTIVLAPNATSYACYVTNYGDQFQPLKPNGAESSALQRAQSNTGPIASVAMEVIKPDSGASQEVRFFVYDTGGKVTDNHIALPTAPDGKLIPFAILDNDTTSGWDGQGKKANPGTCMNCHGGTAPDSPTNPGLGVPYPVASTVVTGANFLPFDAQLFGYDSSGQFSEIAQRQTMRKLNAFVLATSPVAPTISSQIQGWYAWCGGVGASNLNATCAIDDSAHPYTPPGWANATTAQLAGLGSAHAVTQAQAVALYQNVSRKYCRTCHLANSGPFDVQDIDQASSMQSRLNPLANTSSMPNAERTFQDYWNNSGAQGAYNAIWP